ncbi:DUF3500 domain-containing protein [Arenibacter sp. GZD96]|uniref:DUF3500 domain-containing protein n=1 Tax=Aurantibrevibacter litoralis TaxID=3106030 RepID=UPI002AFF61B6|nr:DUF3500 domain-containing protein [Arenibacter sp. GZD-96]MEA1784797.1 DUF3500 domain-containing protein [Arenibacter sp. GZD-96]
MCKKIVLCAILGMTIIGYLRAQDLSAKANTFLQTLPAELRSQTVFPIDDTERFNMNYVPIPRKGLTFHEFNETQKSAAIQLLRATLSKEGYRKTNEIQQLENVLILIENNNYLMPDGKLRRDPLNYHFSIFGTPSPTNPWGWRFEGHHISLNFTSGDGNIISGTPFFLGSNPGIVRIEEEQGKQVLKKESELGFALVNSLNETQLKKAKFSDVAPAEIITENKRKVEGIALTGISYGNLNPTQQKIFDALLNVYIGNYIFEFSERFRKKIENAGMENLHFAWAGSLKEGVAHYYRIHGPMLLIEFDNTQNNANHIHTVIRDLSNDYAEDFLQAHYKKEHK